MTDPLHALRSAFARYREAIHSIKDDLHRDGAIQRFEYTFELSWKALKRELDLLGVNANSPRETLRLAGRNGLIDDVEIWFEFLKKRNLAAHGYREEYAISIESSFSAFEVEVSKIISLLDTSP